MEHLLHRLSLSRNPVANYAATGFLTYFEQKRRKKIKRWKEAQNAVAARVIGCSSIFVRAFLPPYP